MSTTADQQPDIQYERANLPLTSLLQPAALPGQELESKGETSSPPSELLTDIPEQDVELLDAMKKLSWQLTPGTHS